MILSTLLLLFITLYFRYPGQVHKGMPSLPRRKPGEFMPEKGCSMATAVPPVMKGQTTAFHKQVLQQLLQIVNNPTTPEQQQQILRVLVTNP